MVESQVDELAAPGGEAELREAVLRYTREIAFGTAQVYARTAEARGAWDARLEALVVDSLVRGEVDEGLQSWASALNWSFEPGHGDRRHRRRQRARGPDRRVPGPRPAGPARPAGRRARAPAGLVVGGSDDPLEAARHFTGRFGPGPVVVGPAVADLPVGGASASAALAGLRAAGGWPDAPRPVLASDLLPERALDGDELRQGRADRGRLRAAAAAAARALLDTVMTYLEQGNSLEATARLLFVHPNTVRYRLRRVTELTGMMPGDGRGGFSLWMAVVFGRLAQPAP